MNDERSTKQRRREDDTTIIRHLITRHSFDLRHLAPGLIAKLEFQFF
jgi:hypothetical protein